MKCIIIDDEPLARKGMIMLINELSFLELIGEFSNVMDADKFLAINTVDLIFLDISMPEISGLDYLKMISYKPMIVITTAYPDYALEGFNLDVVDYLTKPIKFERFYQAIRKCMKIHGMKESKHPTENFPVFRNENIIFVRSERKFVKLRVDLITHIQALKDYVLIHYENESIPLAINLKAIEKKLSGSMFIRISKSFIVNVNAIKSIEKDLVDIGVCELSIGDAYQKNVKKFLDVNNVIKRDY